jgi:hypothetical protein
MKDNLNKILDECIDRINRGGSIESCLKDFPEYSEKLEPILHAVLKTKTAYSFAPSTRAKNSQRQRFNTALVASRERREGKQSPADRILGWSKVWAPVVAAIVLALVGYFGLRPALMPPLTPPPTSPLTPPPTSPITPQVIVAQPNPEGNFAFLISDEVNDIGDFESLDIEIARVLLHLGGDEEKVIEFEPGVKTVNLADLQGTRAQEIWRGDVPDGEYNKVVLEVSQVSGVLLGSGEEIEIKLPSGKLQISKPFQVESSEVTNFVYDLTVVKAGQNGQYILKPQIGQSGVDQDFIKVIPEGQPDDKGKPEEQPEDNHKSPEGNKGNKPQGSDQ